MLKNFCSLLITVATTSEAVKILNETEEDYWKTWRLQNTSSLADWDIYDIEVDSNEWVNETAEEHAETVAADNLFSAYIIDDSSFEDLKELIR